MFKFKKSISFIVFIVVLILSVFQICSFDIFWHLKVGEIFFKEGFILDINRFSWVCPEYLWTPTYWLFEAFVYMIFKMTGWGGLICFKAFVIAIAFLLLSLSFQKKMPLWITFLLSLILIDLSFFRFMLRPHIFSFLGLSILIKVNSSNLKCRLKPWDFWFYPLLMILWVNLHSGVVYGILFLFISHGSILFRNLTNQKLNRNDLKIVLLLLICSLSVLINPDGTGFISYVLDHVSLDRIINLEEFRKINCILHFKQIFLLMILIVFSSMSIYFQKKFKMEYLLFVILSVYLLNKGLRFIPVACFYLLPGIIYLSKEIEYSHLFRINKLLNHKMVVLIAFLYVFHIHFNVYPSRQSYFKSGFGLHKESFPVDALCCIDFLRDDLKIYNSFSTGGYVIWIFNEKIKVFQDGRIHAYPESFFKKMRIFKSSIKEWEEFLRNYHINVVLIDKNEERIFMTESLKINSDWKIVFEDENFLTAIKKV